MPKVLTIFLLFLVPILCTDESLLQIKGISMNLVEFYSPVKDFTCFDGSWTIPFKYVNDDYCDCNDGSDEPGTSACPNGVFHCLNKGHTNCCDASDEYLTDNCSNICEELGRAAKEKAEAEAKLVELGNIIRLQLVAEAKKMKQTKEDRYNELTIAKFESKKLRDEKEVIKNEIETEENAALAVYKEREEAIKKQKAEEEKEAMKKDAAVAFQYLDSNQDERLQTEEVRVREMFDADKNGEVSESEVKYVMDSNEEISLDYFAEHVWPRVKPFFVKSRGKFIRPEDQEVDDIEKADVEDVEGEDYKEKDYQEVEEEEEEDTKEEEEPKEEKKEESLVYDENTKALIEKATQARAEFDTAQKSLQDIETELTQLSNTLATDYGPESEFAPLEGTCLIFEEREYYYKLCPFDHVVQTSKNGGSETRLGNWDRWETNGTYDTMLYTKGQTCWNGPQRTATVKVFCGLENILLSAAEPNRCEYLFEFQTPAACKIPEKSEYDDLHDEL